MGRKKDINTEDIALWALVTEDVTPIKGRTRPNVAEEASQPTPPAKTQRPKAPPIRVHMADIPPAGGAIGAGLDTRTKNRLERGQMPIEASIDLHGHTQVTARDALTAFLLGAYHGGRRCVLVITGKGRLTKDETKPWWDSQRGVLKSGFGQWIKEPPLDRIILHTALARGHHGGGGAYYVLLRRDRG